MKTDLLCEIVLIFFNKSAGINQGELNIIPGGNGILAVSGYTGEVVHQSGSRVGDPIKKGGLSHIGTAHNCNDRFHGYKERVPNKVVDGRAKNS